MSDQPIKPNRLKKMSQQTARENMTTRMKKSLKQQLKAQAVAENRCLADLLEDAAVLYLSSKKGKAT